jgi:hypothetical protein
VVEVVGVNRVMAEVLACRLLFSSGIEADEVRVEVRPGARIVVSDGDVARVV